MSPATANEGVGGLFEEKGKVAVDGHFAKSFRLAKTYPPPVSLQNPSHQPLGGNRRGYAKTMLFKH